MKLSGGEPPKARWQERPRAAAAAAVWRQWFDCAAPAVITASQRFASASAMRNSSLRVLLPPKASPLRSSRLIQRRGPPSRPESRFISTSGVGKNPKEHLRNTSSIARTADSRDGRSHKSPKFPSHYLRGDTRPAKRALLPRQASQSSRELPVRRPSGGRLTNLMVQPSHPR